jgi:hypothetical protein
LALFAVMAVPTLAAVTKIVTLTETQINDTYWVTNPSWRAVTDRSVDLQVGQVVVSETITPRYGDPITVSATYTPEISNGRIIWTATARTSNGDPVSDELVAQINANMSSSWARFLKETKQVGRVTAIDISEDAITVTLTSRR